MRIAPFKVDLTPPPGFPLAYGFNRRADSPIYLRGLVIDDRGQRAVLASAEIIGFYGGSDELWRTSIAEAADTSPSRVLLHCVHQHDSLQPPSAFVMKRLAGFPDSIRDEWYQWELMRKRVDAAIAAVIRTASRWHTVARIGTAERRMDGLASNRRLLGPNGKVRAMRWSMSTDPALKGEPVGTIDPTLRSIGFFNANGRLIAALHFYASHPMGAYGRKMASADIPGVALDRLHRAVKGRTEHIYLTGCAADITFGKYTTASKRKNLSLLGGRLAEGLIANTRALRPELKPELKLRSAAMDFALNAAAFSRRKLERKLAQATTRHQAYGAAMSLAAVAEWRRWRKAPLYRLDLAPCVHIISFPAETPVEFQLRAQALVPESFVACAAYRNLIYQYICTPEMFKQGGYEPTASVCSEKAGVRMREALEQLLADLRE